MFYDKRGYILGVKEVVLVLEEILNRVLLNLYVLDFVYIDFYFCDFLEKYFLDKEVKFIKKDNYLSNFFRLVLGRVG